MSVIVDELEIGEVRAKSVYLSQDDIETIEKHFNKLLGEPILTSNFDVHSRLEAADRFANEKWSKGGVFEALLTIASNNRLPIKGDTEFFTPSGTVFSIPYELLDIEKVEKLVIVENGELITNWHIVIEHLPDYLRDATILFKGYGANQLYLSAILSAVNANSNICVFFDYDAAGFDMALKLAEHRNVNIIVPKEITKELLKKSKGEQFENQYVQLKKMMNSNTTPSVIKEVLHSIKNNKIAITQEHLIQHHAELAVIENVKVIND